jgi:hypothetical protein
MRASDEWPNEKLSSLGAEVLLAHHDRYCAGRYVGSRDTADVEHSGTAVERRRGNNNVAPNDAREGVTVSPSKPLASNIRLEVRFGPL